MVQNGIRRYQGRKMIGKQSDIEIKMQHGVSEMIPGRQSSDIREQRPSSAAIKMLQVTARNCCECLSRRPHMTGPVEVMAMPLCVQLGQPQRLIDGSHLSDVMGGRIGRCMEVFLRKLMQLGNPGRVVDGRDGGEWSFYEAAMAEVPRGLGTLHHHHVSPLSTAVRALRCRGRNWVHPSCGQTRKDTINKQVNR